MGKGSLNQLADHATATVAVNEASPNNVIRVAAETRRLLDASNYARVSLQSDPLHPGCVQSFEHLAAVLLRDVPRLLDDFERVAKWFTDANSELAGHGKRDRLVTCDSYIGE